jgi:Ca2+-binding RTX toxin-like protein
VRFFIKALALCVLLAALGSSQVATAEVTLPIGPSGVDLDQPLPGIAVGDATVLTPNRVQLSANVNPNGLDTDVYFEYGAGSALTFRTPKVAIGAGADPSTIIADLLGLEPGQSYSYRVVTESSGGTTTSPLFSFATPLTSGSSSTPVFVNIATGAPTINASAVKKNARCTIVGTKRSDVLRGTRKKDVICGLGGNDRITGRGGRDVLLGGTGKDRVTGGSGRDRHYGNSGNDRLNARDRKRGDRVSGGSGRDRASIDRGDRVLAVEAVTRPRKRS